MTRTKWHYTVLQHIIQIDNDGVIKPATAGVPQDEKPIVWFSTNQDWEPTANKCAVNGDGLIIDLNKEQTEMLGGGLVRIGVDAETAPYDWRALKELSGMSGRIAQGLYDAAIACGARPGDWWGTFDPVPRSKWTAAEVFKNGSWVPVPLDVA